MFRIRITFENFIVATRTGDLKIVQQFINENRANLAVINQHTRFGSTALTRAVINNHLEIVKALLIAAADVNAKGEFGRTALFEAVKSNNQEIVALVLEYHADVNIVDDHGDTALIWATENNRFDMVRLLLNSNKIDFLIKNRHGYTASVVAALNNHDKICALINFKKVEKDLHIQGPITLEQFFDAISKHDGATMYEFVKNNKGLEEKLPSIDSETSNVFCDPGLISLRYRMAKSYIDSMY